MPDDFPRPEHTRACRIDVMDLHVAARLKRRRLQLRLEPQLLDVAIGEQSGTIERVERGGKRLGASQLYKLAVVLGVNVSYFFADDLDGDEQEARKVAELPVTDHKALLEAKRFARACARISSPEIKQMIRSLLETLVTDEDIPAIVPPSGDAAREQANPARPAPVQPGHDGRARCERAPRQRPSQDPAPDPWRPEATTNTERKRAP
jgi:transcriptional regulator with XRE-family HTH domain